MKGELDTINDDYEIYGVFKALNKAQDTLWVWQVAKANEQTATKQIHYALVKKVDFEKRQIYIIPARVNRFNFLKTDHLFIYHDQKKIACCTSVRYFGSDYIVVDFPEKISLVSEDFLEQANLVEKEEEERYIHLREAPRKKAEGSRWVRIRRMQVEGGKPASSTEEYLLYDLSKGGMSFIINDPGLFFVGEKIEFFELNRKTLPVPLSGEVTAIRKIDEAVIQFKVGIRFLES